MIVCRLNNDVTFVSISLYIFVLYCFCIVPSIVLYCIVYLWCSVVVLYTASALMSALCFDVYRVYLSKVSAISERNAFPPSSIALLPVVQRTFNRKPPKCKIYPPPFPPPATPCLFSAVPFLSRGTRTSMAATRTTPEVKRTTPAHSYKAGDGSRTADGEPESSFTAGEVRYFS